MAPVLLPHPPPLFSLPPPTTAVLTDLLHLQTSQAALVSCLVWPDASQKDLRGGRAPLAPCLQPTTCSRLPPPYVNLPPQPASSSGYSHRLLPCSGLEGTTLHPLLTPELGVTLLPHATGGRKAPTEVNDQPMTNSSSFFVISSLTSEVDLCVPLPQLTL